MLARSLLYFFVTFLREDLAGLSPVGGGLEQLTLLHGRQNNSGLPAQLSSNTLQFYEKAFIQDSSYEWKSDQGLVFPGADVDSWNPPN